MKKFAIGCGVTGVVGVLALVVIVFVGLRSLEGFLLAPTLEGLGGTADVVETRSVAELLVELDQLLPEHNPQVLLSLNPGMDDAALAAAAASLGGPFPEDLAALYRWHDGSKEMLGPSGDEDALVPFWRFLPNSEALQDKKMIESLPIKVAPGEVLPILGDLRGDYVVMCLSPPEHRGKVFYLIHDDESGPFYPSLANFLTQAVDCYANGIYQRDLQGRLGSDFDAEDAIGDKLILK